MSKKRQEKPSLQKEEAPKQTPSSKEDSRPQASIQKGSIQLESGRERHLVYGILCAAAGLFLLLKLGSIAQWIGVLLLAAALLQTFKGIRGFVRAPGTFQVKPDHVILPTGLCSGKEQRFELSSLQHSYLLRRALPWTQAGPLLVVEAGGQAFAYPRDWFSSDSDQRRIHRTLYELSCDVT